MDETDTDRPDSYRVTADELRQFIERFERLEAEKKDIADQQKEVMAEAKSRGYDTKVMRKVIALRKREPDDIAEEEAVLEMYKEAFRDVFRRQGAVLPAIDQACKIARRPALGVDAFSFQDLFDQAQLIVGVQNGEAGF